MARRIDLADGAPASSSQSILSFGPMPMSRWYRAHCGLVTDAKLGEAALIAGASRALVIATWHALLEAAAETNDGGRFETTPRRVAAILAEPIAAIEAVFAALGDLGMIEAGRVTAWARSARSPSNGEGLRGFTGGMPRAQAMANE